MRLLCFLSSDLGELETGLLSDGFLKFQFGTQTGCIRALFHNKSHFLVYQKWRLAKDTFEGKLACVQKCGRKGKLVKGARQLHTRANVT